MNKNISLNSLKKYNLEKFYKIIIDKKAFK